MLISYRRGQTSVVLRVKLLNSSVSTGAGLTGLTSASTGLIISTIANNEATPTAYTVAGSTIETITTLGTFAAPTATKCRFKEVDATNHKGIYEIQIADARFAVASAKSLLISLSGATNLAECDALIPLTDLDPYDSVRAGLTALPNAAAEAAGGLYTRGTGAGQLNQAANGQLDANAVAVSGDTTAADNLETMLDGTGGQTLSLGKLNVVNSAGDAIVASSTGGNGRGIAASGNGTGDGANFKGGTTGRGGTFEGGATGGEGLRCVAVAGTSPSGFHAQGFGNGSGVNGIGAGTGSGMHLEGGTDGLSSVGYGVGSGMALVGGANGGSGTGAGEAMKLQQLGNGFACRMIGGTGTSADALRLEGGAQSSGLWVSAGATGPHVGARFTGTGSLAGMQIVGGATGVALSLIGGATSGDGLKIATTEGHAVNLVPGGTSKHALLATGAALGTSDGIKAVAGAAGGVDIRGNITGTLTGAVSGAVGSVTGNVGGNVVGSVASVTAGVTLAASAVQAIWDALTSALTTAGSIGKRIVDYLTGDSYARLGAPAGASIAADLVVIEAQTDDIGSAGAGLTAVPWNAAWDAEVQSEVQDAIEVNHLDHLLAVDYDPASKPGVATALLNELVESDVGVSRYTANALEQAPSGTGASAASIRAEIDANSTQLAAIVADTNELQTDWANGGRLDLLLDSASSAGDPWSTAIPGAYGAGTAGKIVGDNINATISSRLASASITLASGKVTVGTNDDKTGYALTSAYDPAKTAAQAGDAMALTSGERTTLATAVWASATRTLSSFGTLAADVWSSVTRLLTAGTNIVLAKGVGVTGFNDLSVAQVNAEADTALADAGVTTTVTGRIDAAVSTRASQTALDTVDDFLDTEVAAIKAKTDQFVFTTANRVDSTAVAVSTGGIAAASFAAGAIDAAAIAPDAIGASEWAAGAASEMATAVRTELTTELGRIDAAVSSRLASGTIAADVTAVKAKTDLLPDGIQKNTAFPNFPFLMVDATDHVTQELGLTVTAQRRLDAGAFAACANAVTEVGAGIYTIDLAAADLNGDVVTLKFTATGADTRFVTVVTS